MTMTNADYQSDHEYRNENPCLGQRWPNKQVKSYLIYSNLVYGWKDERETMRYSWKKNNNNNNKIRFAEPAYPLY